MRRMGICQNLWTGPFAWNPPDASRSSGDRSSKVAADHAKLEMFWPMALQGTGPCWYNIVHLKYWDGSEPIIFHPFSIYTCCFWPIARLWSNLWPHRIASTHFRSETATSSSQSPTASLSRNTHAHIITHIHTYHTHLYIYIYTYHTHTYIYIYISMPPVCRHVPAVIMMYLFVLILCFSAPNDPTSRRWLWNSAIFFPWADMVRDHGQTAKQHRDQTYQSSYHHDHHARIFI